MNDLLSSVCESFLWFCSKESFVCKSDYSNCDVCTKKYRLIESFTNWNMLFIKVCKHCNYCIMSIHVQNKQKQKPTVTPWHHVREHAFVDVLATAKDITSMTNNQKLQLNNKLHWFGFLVLWDLADNKLKAIKPTLFMCLVPITFHLKTGVKFIKDTEGGEASVKSLLFGDK